MTNLLVCPNCGRACKEDDCICPSCGYIFEENVQRLKDKVEIEKAREIIRKNREDETNSYLIKNKNKKDKKKIVIVGIVVILIAFFGFELKLKIDYDKQIELYNEDVAVVTAIKNCIDVLESSVDYSYDVVINSTEFFNGNSYAPAWYTNAIESILSQNAESFSDDIEYIDNNFNKENKYYIWGRLYISEIISNPSFEIINNVSFFIQYNENGEAYRITGNEAINLIEIHYPKVKSQLNSFSKDYLEYYPKKPENKSIFK